MNMSRVSVSMCIRRYMCVNVHIIRLVRIVPTCVFKIICKVCILSYGSFI